jgi:hypothetical protein
MKSKKYIKLGLQRVLVLFLILAMLPACDERWEEMNTDPNRLSSLPDEYLFTNAVRQTFRDQFERFDIDFGGQFGHIWISNSWNREADKYNDIQSQGDIYERVFRGVYNGSIRNIVEVMQMTGPGGDFENSARHAQANIIATLNFSRLTDFFGDIPYFEGGMGKYDILKPVYDSQEMIYEDMVSRLQDAISVLKAASDSEIYPSTEDPLFAGNRDNWIRFANSLRLRLAMHARFVDPTTYNAVITECLGEVLIEENSQNVKLAMEDSNNTSLYNPWHNKYIDSQAGLYTLNWSEKFIETLKASNDPRLAFFATKNNDDEYLGMPNGLNDTYYSGWSRANSSLATEEFFAKDQPMYHMVASEIYFLRAEAALFGLGSGDANTLYQTGIEMAMDQWSIEDSLVTKFLTEEAEASLFGDQENSFRQIATQLWISFVPAAFEGWTTIRRTGYPVIEQRTSDMYSKGVTDGYMPTRLKYPFTVEASVNGVNQQAAIESMGGDKIDLPLWWDVR